MTTFEHRKRPLARLGAIIGLVPIATSLPVGVGAALMTLSLPFGGANTIFTAVRYVAVAAAPTVLIAGGDLDGSGAASRSSPDWHLRDLLTWSGRRRGRMALRPWFGAGQRHGVRHAVPSC
jgi:hypothetical protein